MQIDSPSTTLALSYELTLSHSPSWGDRLMQRISNWGPFSRPMGIAPSQGDSDVKQARGSFHDFQAMLAKPHLRSVLRERLEKRPGTENYQFLLVCRSFEVASNALERFQLLHHLVETHVNSGSPKAVPISASTRSKLQKALAKWGALHRVPANVNIAGLPQAREEITRHVIATSEDPFQRELAAKAAPAASQETDETITSIFPI